VCRRSSWKKLAPRKTTFREKERRQFDPWLVSEAKFRNRREKAFDEDKEVMKTAFVDLAKSGTVSATESVMACYSLFMDPRYMASLLVCEVPEQRIVAHNFLVAKTIGEDFLAPGCRRLFNKAA
jgi:hypothetical protein